MASLLFFAGHTPNRDSTIHFYVATPNKTNTVNTTAQTGYLLYPTLRVTTQMECKSWTLMASIVLNGFIIISSSILISISDDVTIFSDFLTFLVQTYLSAISWTSSLVKRIPNTFSPKMVFLTPKEEFLKKLPSDFSGSLAYFVLYLWKTCFR